MAEITDIQDYCETVSKLCVALQGKQETVSAHTVERALEYAKDLPLKTASEVMLFCASINLMNAYVKQKNNRMVFGYGFKTYVGRLLNSLSTSPVDGVSFSVVQDSGSMLATFDVCGLQFSYHGVSYPKGKVVSVGIPFDGTHKQQCANTLFMLAEVNPFLSCANVQTQDASKGDVTAVVTQEIGRTKHASASAKVSRSCESARRAKKSTNNSRSVRSIGDAVACTIVRIGRAGAYVKHADGRGLIPFAEMPTSWVDDPWDLVDVGDDVNAQVLAVYPSGFLKLSGKNKKDLPGNRLKPRSGAR